MVNKTGNSENNEPSVKPPKKEKTKQSKKEKTEKVTISGIIKVIKGDRFQKVLGLFFLLLSFYLLIAFISYLFTWKADDNIFSNPISRVLTDNSLTSENWMGKIGAVLSFIFIKKWFGVASFMFICWLVVIGLRLFLNYSLYPLSKATKYMLFGMLWISITISFIIRSDELLILGGAFGYQSNIWLNSILGKIGTGILLFFVMACFLIIEYNIQKIWQKKVKPQEEETEEETDGYKPARNEYAIDHLKIQDEEEDEPDVDFELITKPSGIENSESIELDNTLVTDKSKPSKDNIPFTVSTTEEIDAVGKGEDVNEVKHFTIDTDYDPTLDLPTYQFPTLEMLKGIRLGKYQRAKRRTGSQQEPYPENPERLFYTDR